MAAREHLSHSQPDKPEDLKLRSYQQELAEKAMNGKNCVIVAPTGSGKTHVALAIVKVWHTFFYLKFTGCYHVAMKRKNLCHLLSYFV